MEIQYTGNGIVFCCENKQEIDDLNSALLKAKDKGGWEDNKKKCCLDVQDWKIFYLNFEE